MNYFKLRVAILVFTMFMIFCWSIFLWVRLTPSKTPEQTKRELYDYCVSHSFINHQDIDNCNKIK